MGAIRATGAVLAVGLGLMAMPAAAGAQYPSGPYAPWNGANPFNCVLQDAGFGTTVPDPGADPYCVEFDKSQQNLSEFGMFDFLANEPARVAAATPKCFYYQSDHWTASVVQGVPPEIWHWDGQYFFDKAIGIGGVNVQNFRILGQPASPGAYGEVPPEFAPYFDQSGGGSYLIGDVDADPACVAQVDTPAERAQIYAGGNPPPGPPPQAPPGTAPTNTILSAYPSFIYHCRRSKGAPKHGAGAAKRKGCKQKKRRR